MFPSELGLLDEKVQNMFPATKSEERNVEKAADTVGVPKSTNTSLEFFLIFRINDCKIPDFFLFFFFSFSTKNDLLIWILIDILTCWDL